MTVFPASIARFWRRHFLVAPTSRTSVGIAVGALFVADSRVMILETPDGETRALITPEIASMLDEPIDGAWSPARLKARLNAIDVVLNGADHLFYFPQAAAASLHLTPADPSIRRLTEEDAALFAAFEAEASQQDLDDSLVDLDDWAVFGAFENGRLAAAASIYPWNGSRSGSDPRTHILIGYRKTPQVNPRSLAHRLRKTISVDSLGSTPSLRICTSR